jgi:lipoyl-dependent peroxiredoxin
VTFVPGTGITKIALSVRGRVPYIDEAAFHEAAEGAKAGGPISQALTGVPEITLDARLEG